MWGESVRRIANLYLQSKKFEDVRRAHFEKKRIYKKPTTSQRSHNLLLGNNSEKLYLASSLLSKSSAKCLTAFVCRKAERVQCRQGAIPPLPINAIIAKKKPTSQPNSHMVLLVRLSKRATNVRQRAIPERGRQQKMIIKMRCQWLV